MLQLMAMAKKFQIASSNNQRVPWIPSFRVLLNVHSQLVFSYVLYTWLFIYVQLLFIQTSGLFLSHMLSFGLVIEF